MRKKNRLVGGKIIKRSIFQKYNPIRSLKIFFGLTKKETYHERQKRQNKNFNNFIKKKQKERNNKKSKKLKK